MLPRLVNRPVNRVKGPCVARGERRPQTEWIADRDAQRLRTDRPTSHGADGVHGLGDAAKGRKGRVVRSIEGLTRRRDDIFILKHKIPSDSLSDMSLRSTHEPKPVYVGAGAGVLLAVEREDCPVAHNRHAPEHLIRRRFGSTTMAPRFGSTPAPAPAPTWSGLSGDGEGADEESSGCLHHVAGVCFSGCFDKKRVDFSASYSCCSTHSLAAKR